MSLYWEKCVECNGRGETEVGNRWQRLFKLEIKIVQCPACKGRGSVPVKSFPFQPWRKDNR